MAFDVLGQACDHAVEALLDAVFEVRARPDIDHAHGAVAHRRDDADDLELGGEGAGQIDRGVDRSGRLVGAVVGDADPTDRLVGARAVAVWDDRDRAGRAVQEPLAGAARGDAAEMTGVGGADDDDLGALGVREVVQGVRG